MEDFQAIAQLAADLTTTVVALALLFAERRAHDATRAQLEEARREHLADLRQMAYSSRPPTPIPLYDQHPARYPTNSTSPPQ